MDTVLCHNPSQKLQQINNKRGNRWCPRKALSVELKDILLVKNLTALLMSITRVVMVVQAAAEFVTAEFWEKLF